jgi:hypothetical protein
MGMEQIVTFPAGSQASWQAARDLLASHGFAFQIRMIDGQLAFPDEVPPENWRELRLATTEAMVTVRREQNRLVLVVWGNADARLVHAWNALTWAFAHTGHGRIESSEGTRSAEEYRNQADLPAVLRKNPMSDG